ncbi:2-succinyl-5-enolpyruvyl-6-hydroxy-3-cyclohexene-1-carboxylic-acid synthase [Isoptericola sp. b441]|uniref:2-succinyl-5-enolpyruvyl-6-hydroxy-3-cyclohexene-1-carboxylate synthase n=1 Tax=Actinotalea lenta TaxID=3064654 RepID=A0ABT9D6Y2_9CELL|nr:MULTISPECIES: 2-succinyl-5-enolpyruvyl-6-hydroxy-3-cyclohexene-1-carboxylic-acid synthase [unclassified Isoptericola]MDO8105803.1 2-succinyl-5-enolpyruvyl-6-hydroxy-3-cyclohexene-1-carboxylic-acid synthase [Isoptericola sp. b441]MDO8122508.1 2-succinyl-5-enolpyruvyl-6-hydroxy-3-cyclohexene-1-carboxylic-acid synthase [Isoptericola sp. b490]
MTPNPPAARAARTLMQALADLGVADVVVAPGSRSAPLAYAAAEAALPPDHPARDLRAPRLRVHVRVDERVAGFLALGLARAAKARKEPRAVAVVTTSGTAPAHLLPAVLEARHAGLPLLLLTADRPHELRGTGANQTTEQVGLLAPAVRLSVDVPAPVGLPDEERDLRNLAARVVAVALGTRDHTPGPVHVNLAYREPLVPDGPWPERSADGLTRVLAHPGTPAGAELAAFSDVARPVSPPDGVRTVVVAGDGAGPEASVVAHANEWPLLAEPSSGAGGGPNAIAAYRLLLDHPELGGAVQRVVVLGRPTLSRPVQALLARPDVEVMVIAEQGRDWPDAARRADQVVPGVPGSLLRGNLGAGLDWLGRWRRAGVLAAGAVADVLAAESADAASGPLLAAVVASSLGPQDVLVVSASNPVRDLDLVARWEDPPLVVANRGLAGIDGTLSTAAGLSLGLGRPVRAYVGDLAFLHDAGALLMGPDEPRPDLQVVVAADGGGSIFATLEHGERRLAHLAERVMATPHRADLGALCAGYGVPHRRVDVDELPAALARPVQGLEVLEVPVDRAERRALTGRLADAVHVALADLQ